jgi:ABC-2 type transport system permease protein
MKKTVRLILMFLKRDFLLEASYKFAFVSSLFGIVLSSATFFFISKLVPRAGGSSLEPYGGDFFSFVIIGVAFSGILGLFQEGLPGIIRAAQTTGTLEALLVTQTNMITILMGSSLFPLFYSLLRTVIHLAVAIFVFGMQLGDINWIGAVSVFFLTSVSFLSIGIFSASFILVYKMGNPLSWLFGSLSGLFGGVLFPISILPDWLRWISYLLPITYSLEGLRLSLLSSASLSEILPNILALLGFSGVLFPLSLFIFRASLKKAKKDGTLMHY